MFYSIPDDTKNYVVSHNTAKVAKLKVPVLQLLNVQSHNIMSLLHDMKIMSHDIIFLSLDKSVDLTGVLSCRATLFEHLRHNLLSLRQVSNM